MEAKRKKELISMLETLLKDLASGKIEFLGVMRDSKPKFKAEGIILKVRKSPITTITFQYKYKDKI